MNKGGDIAITTGPGVMVKRVLPYEWDKALPLLSGATFFDTARWQEAFSYKTENIYYLHFFYKNRLIAGFSCGSSWDSHKHVFLSPFTAAFGGVLARSGISLTLWVKVIDALRDYFTEETGAQAYEIHYTRRSRCLSGGICQEAEDMALVQNGFSLNCFFCDIFFDMRQEVHLAKTNASALRKSIKAGEFEFMPATVEEFLEFRARIIHEQNKRMTVPDDQIIKGTKLFPECMRYFKAVSNSGSIVAVLLEDHMNEYVAMGRNWFVDKKIHAPQGLLFLVYNWIESVRSRCIRYAGFGSCANSLRPLNSNVLFFKERFSPAVYDAKKTYILESK